MKTNELKKYIENMIDKPDSDETIAGYMKSNDVSYEDLIAVIRMSMKPTPQPLPKPVKLPPCKTSKEAAVQIRKAAKQWRDAGYDSFENDPKMLKVYDTDAKDLKAVASLLDEDKCKEAMNKAYRLDTVVRECIPEPAWDYLQKFDR